jgi:SWIM zinc finger
MEFDSFPPGKKSDFESYFSSKTLGKAREIVGDEMLKLLERSGTHLSARVQGSEPRPYQVMIRADGSYECSCPSEVQPCKHVAATLLYAMQAPDEETLDLTTFLQGLDAVQAKTLLLDLAEHGEVRALLLQRRIKTAQVAKGAIKALCKILERGKNIELEGELGEQAFAELEHLNAQERSVRATELYDLLDDYELDYSDYDDYNEDGDAYWEDRQSEWMGRAMQSWASAELELGRGEAAFKTLLSRLEHSSEMWEAVLQLAKGLQEAGNTQAKDQLARWLDKHSDNERFHALKRYTREFLQTLRSPEDYETYLRDNLETAADHLELFNHLQGQQRSADALDVAQDAVRTLLANRKSNPWINLHGELEQLITVLRRDRPGFEWERAAFALRPSVAQYKALKKHAEFAAVRKDILKTDMTDSLLFDLLLEDDDHATLEKLLKHQPRPELALKVSHLFAKPCAEIFRKAALEEVKQNSGEHYKQGARWADEYRKLENAAKFKVWLSDLLAVHVRRPALQDEFKKLKASLK